VSLCAFHFATARIAPGLRETYYLCPPMKSVWLSAPRFFFVAFTFFSVISGWAQSFQPGYIEESGGTKIQCLIENRDWKHNPLSIVIKANLDDVPLTVGIDSLNGFSVGDHRYIKAAVRYDTSSQDLKKLSNSRQPFWMEGTLLLRVIVDGDADLFRYHTDSLTLYFYKVRQQPIEQLVHKYYLSRDPHDSTAFTKKRISNLTYLEQLKKNLRCSSLSAVNEVTTPYRLRQLSSYFRNYNTCIGSKYKDFTQQGTSVSIRVRPGLDLSSVKALDNFGTTVLFPDITSLRGGVEVEFDLPLPKKAWTLVVEPTYQSYRTQRPYRLEYRSIEVPIGIRRYFRTSETTRLYLNPLLISDFPITYEMDFSRTVTFDISGFKINFGLAGGINFGKFTLEGRLHTVRRGKDNDTQSIDFAFRKTSVILGYTIF
jgi:hypothetical protein